MRLITLVLASFVCLPAGAEEIADPWALLPALPTACYAQEDTYSDQAYAAAATLDAERIRQDEINLALSQQLSNIDPMEQQQRMMDFMMENPQEAQKYMESVAGAGATANEEMPKFNDESYALQAERQTLDADYGAAVNALDQAYRDGIAGLFEEPQKFDADFAKYSAAVDAYNGGYANLCARYLKNGLYYDWLARQQDLERRLVALSVDNDVTAENYRMFGIDADQYRSTYELSAAKRQVDAALQIFNRRKLEPMVKEDFVPGP